MTATGFRIGPDFLNDALAAARVTGITMTLTPEGGVYCEYEQRLRRRDRGRLERCRLRHRLRNLTDFPTTPGAYQMTGSPSANADAFVSKLAPDVTGLAYSTCGGDWDCANGIALDSSGAAYITDATNSSDFPTSPTAYRPTNAGGLADTFVSKFTFEPSALTGTANDVSATSATLNGTVNPVGSTTTYEFDYGTSSCHGSCDRS